MALTKITSDGIGDNAITSTKIAAGAVTIADIPDGEITAAKLHTTAVTDKLGYTPVNPSSLGALASLNSVSTSNITDSTITANKLASGVAISNIGYTPVNKAGDTADKPIKHSSYNDITNGNLNTLIVGGLYMGYNLTNGPVGAAWASVHVTTNGSDQIFQHHQEAGYDGGLIHVRFSTNGGSSWSSWTQVATPGTVTNDWIPSTGRIMRNRGSFSSSESGMLNGLDSYWGNANEGYWAVGRPGYSSALIVMNMDGSTGTIQWATSYDSAMYRRNRTDNNSWTSWRQQD